MNARTGKRTIKPSGEPVARLGLISHVGLAVKNCDEAGEFYSRVFGIEFEVDDYDMSKGKFFNLEGKPGKARFRAAYGQVGSIGIELVEVPEGDTPQTKFLRQHGEGLQHMCFFVDDIQDAMARLKDAGIRPMLDYEMEMTYEGKRSRIQEVSLNTDQQLGGMTIELLKVDPLD